MLMGVLEKAPGADGEEARGAAKRLFVPWDAFGRAPEGRSRARGRRLLCLYPKSGLARLHNVKLDPGRRYFVEIRRDLSQARVVEADAARTEGVLPDAKGRLRIAALRRLPGVLFFEFAPGTLEGARVDG
jgi:hypothetical protein